MVTVASVHDSKAALLLMPVLGDLLCGIKTSIADDGYRGELAKQVRKRFGYLIQIIMRMDDKKQALNQHMKEG